MDSRNRMIRALSFLVLFVSFQISVVSFVHTHIINGSTIVHSHPFTGEHEHTADNVIQLAQLSLIQSLEAEVVTIDQPLRPLVSIIEEIPATPLYKCGFFEYASLRAPPAVFFI